MSTLAWIVQHPGKQQVFLQHLRVLFTFVFVGVFATLAYAQEAISEKAYDELPVKADWEIRGRDKRELSAINSAIRERESLVKQVVQGTKTLEGSQAELDEFFTGYIFPRWTQKELIQDPKQFNFLAMERKRLFNAYIHKCASLTTNDNSVHPHLVDLALAKCTEIARGNYHPAARFSAMLVIADLNSQDKIVGSNNPAVPLAKALPLMIDEFTNDQQIDAVRVACLVGIMRHVTSDASAPAGRRVIPDELRNRINTLALSVVNQKDRPANRSIDGQAWLQRRSLEILSSLGTLESDVNVGATIESMIADGGAPLALRFSAAEALVQLNNPIQTKLTAQGTAKKMGELALHGLNTEIARIKDDIRYQDAKERWSTGAPQGGMGGQPGGAGGAPAGGPGQAGIGAGGGAGAGSSAGLDDGGGGARGRSGGGSSKGFQAGGSGRSGPPGMAGGMGGGMSGGMGGGMGGARGGAATAKRHTDEHKLELAKRRFKSYMHSVLIGLEGQKVKVVTKTRNDDDAADDAAGETPETAVTANTGSSQTGLLSLAKSEPDREYVKRIAAKVAEIHELMDDRSLDDLEDLVKRVQGKAKELESACGVAKAGGKEELKPEDDAPAGAAVGAAPADNKPASPAADSPESP